MKSAFRYEAFSPTQVPHFHVTLVKTYIMYLRWKATSVQKIENMAGFNIGHGSY